MGIRSFSFCIIISIIFCSCIETGTSPGNETPVNIYLINPKDNSESESIYQQFSWSHNSKDGKSTLCIAKDSSFKTDVRKFLISDFKYNIDTLEFGTKYYWYVSVSANGKEYKSTVRSFITGKFIPNGNINIMIKGLHYWNEQGVTVSKDMISFNADYKYFGNFSLVNNKFEGSYSYAGTVYNESVNSSVNFDVKYFKSLEADFIYSYSSSAAYTYNWRLNLRNVPISAVSDSSIIYRINGTACPNSFVSYQSLITNGQVSSFYTNTEWDNDSYIIIEFKK